MAEGEVGFRVAVCFGIAAEFVRCHAIEGEGRIRGVSGLNFPVGGGCLLKVSDVFEKSFGCELLGFAVQIGCFPIRFFGEKVFFRGEQGDEFIPMFALLFAVCVSISIPVQPGEESRHDGDDAKGDDGEAFDFVHRGDGELRIKN